MVKHPWNSSPYIPVKPVIHPHYPLSRNPIWKPHVSVGRSSLIPFPRCADQQGMVFARVFASLSLEKWTLLLFAARVALLVYSNTLFPIRRSTASHFSLEQRIYFIILLEQTIWQLSWIGVESESCTSVSADYSVTKAAASSLTPRREYSVFLYVWCSYRIMSGGGHSSLEGFRNPLIGDAFVVSFQPSLYHFWPLLKWAQPVETRWEESGPGQQQYYNTFRQKRDGIHLWNNVFDNDIHLPITKPRGFIRF